MSSHSAPVRAPVPAYTPDVLAAGLAGMVVTGSVFVPVHGEGGGRVGLRRRSALVLGIATAIGRAAVIPLVRAHP